MLGTIITYGVHITPNVSEHLYNLAAKGQCQTVLKSFITQNSSFIFDDGVHI